ncbi:CubicO group peptidase, beta-lactamase class C family [Rhizobium sp. NFR07]|uniref:serine hydrolase domain-containing protein n=1 Tax=Rhizobium sp. NFR07 TaxID=1566262 RepID=UPI0008EF657C|nr:serine hydrolase [Rhizobium sp. NFR07]SFB42343.1 CubicO group peptidase, beta-lactamase class C family [Rhizobium sp. NFR07]
MNPLAMFVALLFLSAQAADAADCGTPIAAAEAGYLVPSPSTAQETGCRLIRQLDETRLNLHSVLILHKGILVFEHYRAGQDQPWGASPGHYEYGMGDLHDVRSVGKSVMSLLVGIAVDRGLIKSLDQSVFDYLPDYRDLASADRQKISLRMLLTMTSGFHSNEQLPYMDANNTERLMAVAPDPYRAVLERRLTAAPGSRWAYSGGDTMLLSKILQNASEKSLTAFAEENLFGPLGISSYRWVPLKTSGEIAAYGSLKLRPRDMAKLGLLVLQQGKWDGRQVVSEEWLKISTAAQQDAWFPYRYAMHWWSGDVASDAGGRIPTTIALGIGGQRIVVIPAMDAVVVITAGLYDDPDQMRKMTGLLSDIIIPAMRGL